MMICAWLPHFALRVSVPRRADLSGPVALVSALDTHPVVRACSPAARREGVVPGMLVSRALGTCAQLTVLAYDEEVVEQAAEQYLARLESIGAAVHPIVPGRAVFAGTPLLRLYGGMDGVLAEVCRVFRVPDLRIGVGPNVFVSWIAARHAPAGGHVLIREDEAARVLARMPVSLLPADARMLELFAALGLATMGDLAAIGVDHVADRFGADGVRMHELAQGIDTTVVQPRIPVDPIEEAIQFPEPVGHHDVLHRALRMLVERAVAHPRCVQHAPRSIVVVCGLVPASAEHARGSSPSHRAQRSLRTPTTAVDRIMLAARTVFDDVPAPVERLVVRLEQFAVQDSPQAALFGERTTALTGGDTAVGISGVHDPRVQAGLRHVQAILGDDAVLQVLEVQPGSRVPERHVVLVPRSDAGGDAV